MTRYALRHTGPDGQTVAQYAPVVGDLAGFETATAAMLHIYTVLPAEAHLWHWVPISSPGPRSEEVKPCPA